MPREFVTTIKTTGGDYTTLSAWTGTQSLDLTTGSTKVFYGSFTGSANFNAWGNAGLIRGGVDQGITGSAFIPTASFVNSSSAQILLKNINNGNFAFAVGDQWLSGSSYFTINDVGNGEIGAISVAECYSKQDTVTVVLGGPFTSSIDNYVIVRTPLSERHTGSFTTSKYYLDGSTTLLSVRLVPLS